MTTKKKEMSSCEINDENSSSNNTKETKNADATIPDDTTKTTATSTTTTTTSNDQMLIIPSLSDRQYLLGLLEDEVHRRMLIWEEQSTGKEYAIQYLRSTVLPSLSAALLVSWGCGGGGGAPEEEEEEEEEPVKEEKDEESSSSEKEGQQEEQEHNITDTIALLLNNVLHLSLQSKIHYDARLRSIVKTVVIPLLEEAYYTNNDDDDKEKNDDDNTTTEAELLKKESIPVSDDDDNDNEDTPQPPKNKKPNPRGWYMIGTTCTKKSSSSNKDDDMDLGAVQEIHESISHSMKVPTLSSLQKASKLFESMERIIGEQVVKATLEKAAKEEAVEEAERVAAAVAAAAAAKQEEETLKENSNDTTTTTTDSSSMEEEEQPSSSSSSPSRTITKKQLTHHLVRGLKITSVGLVVGAAFAVTGGLAAPGLVAAISALSAGSGLASTVAFATLTSVHALMSMFGVVGGGLAAYKMKKRTQGLSEWRIRQEYQNSMPARIREENTNTTDDCDDDCDDDDDEGPRAAGVAEEEHQQQEQDQQQQQHKIRGLHAHVCISGWLHASSDFQIPWGVNATDPKLDTDLEVLQRYFAVHQPEKICFCPSLLEKFNPNNSRKQSRSFAYQQHIQDLYAGLADVYGGSHPETLLPLDNDDDEERSTIHHLSDSTNTHNNELVLNELDQVYEANSMLIEMERMNQEMFSNNNQAALTVLDAIRDDYDDGTFVKDDYDDDKEDALVENFDSQTTTTATATDDSSSSSSGGVWTTDSNAKMSMEEFLAYSVQEEQKKLQRNNETNPDRMKWKNDITTEEEEEEEKDAENDSQEDNSTNDDDGATKTTDATSESAKTTTKDDDDNKKVTTTTTTTTTTIIYDWSAHYSGELYTITWESKALLNLCNIMDVLAAELTDLLAKQLVTGVVLAGAIAIPSTMVTCLSVVDDPYQLIRNRARAAGIELAHCLLSSEEEQRPISLVGFSFGASVILSCLEELAKHQDLWEERQREEKECLSPTSKNKKGLNHNNTKKLGDRWKRWKEQRQAHKKKKDVDTLALERYPREPASIIDDVVVMGLPETHIGTKCRRMVAGRFINCYKPDDYILVYMVHVRCWKFVGGRGCGGTTPMVGVENVNVADLVSTHSQYGNQVAPILHRVGYGNPIVVNNNNSNLSTSAKESSCQQYSSS